MTMFHEYKPSDITFAKRGIMMGGIIDQPKPYRLSWSFSGRNVWLQEYF
ncbi:hypothetical protein EMIT07CA2_550085 [Brevibacillus sp. IT-7CA2]